MTMPSDVVAAHGYQALFFGHPDATYLLDTEGNYLDCNQPLLDLVARSQNELLAMNFAPIVHPEFVEVTAAGFAMALSGETAQYLTRGVRPDGSFFDIDVTNIPLVDESGAVTAVFGIARDVGHVQALSDALERNATVMRMAGRISKFAGWSLEARSGELYWSSELFRMLSVPDTGGTPPLEVALRLYPEPHATIVGEAVNACVTRGTPIDLECIIVDGRGLPLNVRILGEAIRDDDGTILRVHGSFFDITDVIAERQERARLESALNTTLNRVRDLIVIVDRDGKTTFANSAALELAGASRDGASGRAIEDLIPGIATPEYAAAYERAMVDGLVGRARIHAVAAHVWLDVTAHPTDGGAAVILRDITADVEAERASREASERYEMQASLFQISANAIFTYDVDRRITLWNQAAADLYECSIEDATGQLVDDVIIHDGPSVAELADEDLNRTGKWAGILRHRTVNGKRITVSSRVQRITTNAAAGSIMASNTDITQTEADRAARLDVELRLQTTLDQIHDGMSILDRDWRFTFVNKPFESYSRRSAVDLIGAVLWDEFPEAFDSPFGELWRQSMDDRVPGTVRAYYAPLENWFESTAYPTEDGIAVYVRSVTDEEESARERQESDSRMRRQAALLDAARDAILVMDVDGTVTYVNQSARSTFLLPDAEHALSSVTDLLGDEGGMLDHALTAVTEEGSWDGDVVHTLHDGRRLVTDARWQLIRDAHGAPDSILAIHTDVTADRERDLERNRAQRLESLGTLAGGIAHDLNNILTPILMSSQLMATMTTDADLRSLLSAVETSARRGADMIRQVLSFARGTDGAQAELDLREVLDDASRLMAEVLPKNIEFRMQVDDLSTISGDSTQILQVLLNLITNASDAMPDGGVLTLEARVDAVRDDQAELVDAGVRRCVTITVTDTGTGMDEGTRERIFEPFFTTKQLGEGTGLGLATSVAIVRSHGGTIAVESRLGRGTTATVCLPIGRDALPASTADSDDTETPRGRGELILVVDDEEPIRRVVRDTLHAFGYRTLEAENGRRAIEVAEASETPIALVLTDMMMPVMDGAATASYFFSHHPAVAVVAVSGLKVNGGVARASHAGVQFFVPKPFTASTLLRTIRAAIDERVTSQSRMR